LKYLVVSQQLNTGSRVYLMEPGSTTTYQTFNVNNQEFVSPSITFLPISPAYPPLYPPCDLNGALHFTQMDADSGVAKSNGSNRAGAKYGTGYCGAQCPKDINFINGVANSNDSTP
ncbi:glycoside hydrolase, partial [Mycena olivaceomarginata]